MTKLHLFAAAALCGGGLLLCGCHHEDTSSIPTPAPGVAQPVQAQIQEVENNPHIPPAQKAAIEAQIKSSGGAAAPPAPSQNP